MDENVLSQCNVVWTSPSTDHNGSMPLGNGETGVNFWVEKSGNLLLLISRTDSWDEINRLCKLGRLNMKIFPQITSDAKFTQTLDLCNGMATIEFQNKEIRRTVVLWVDANHQVIHLQIESSDAFKPHIISEIWRTCKEIPC